MTSIDQSEASIYLFPPPTISTLLSRVRPLIMNNNYCHIDQSEASIPVTWPVVTNQRPVQYSCDLTFNDQSEASVYHLMYAWARGKGVVKVQAGSPRVSSSALTNQRTVLVSCDQYWGQYLPGHKTEVWSVPTPNHHQHCVTWNGPIGSQCWRHVTCNLHWPIIGQYSGHVTNIQS